MKIHETNLTREELLSGKRPGQRATILAPKGNDPEQERQEIIFKEESERRLDLADVRERLSGKEGTAFWQSLEELAEKPEFTELMAKEFPRLAPDLGSVDRRSFLKLMGASMAMAGLTACTKQPPERIVPYVRPPEEFVPGKSVYFATTMPLGGYAMGLLAESHMGRPTKVEGNPEHPASLGSSDAIAQASVLGLYDPDRSQAVKSQGRDSSWQNFRNTLTANLAAQANVQGVGLRLLTETITSPSQAHLIEAVLEKYPRAKWIQYDAVSRDNTRAGAQLAFGDYVDTVYHFDKADVILSVDADFLGEGPAHVRYARDFSRRRDVAVQGTKMNRLYTVESVPSLTGANADHTLSLRSLEMESLVRAVARALGLDAPGADLSDEQQRWAHAVADDLRAHRGAAVVVAGERQAPVVHALVHAINAALDSAGNTVTYIEPVEARPDDQHAALRELVSDIEAGTVRMLLQLDVNPVLTAPADLNFQEHLEQVPFSAHLGLYEDETAVKSQWHVPMAHYLEGWGDARAFDGTTSIIQPLIEPLYDGRTVQELLALCVDRADESAHDLVKSFWEEQGVGDLFATAWRKALHDGVIADSASAAKSVNASTAFPAQDEPPTGMELVFTADSATWDGRFANNAWLQEMPRALTKLTWDNAVLVSPATAEEHGWANGDVVEIAYEGRSVQGPVWVHPGQARNSVSVQLGYGRRHAGVVGNEVGFDAYRLRTTTAPWVGAGVTLTATGERYKLATTQRHHRMEGLKDRNLVRVASLAQFLKNPDFAHEKAYEPKPDETMFPPWDYSKGYQWGMTINLNTCIGCNACLVACQSENNIPVVGKHEVGMGREMHWIRIDRYYSGDLDQPDTHVQPVPCMHCENAPCEPVCPVAATVHSADGLNQMVYNRCIGTRYCANNCPYKVRRFNFLQYTDETTPQLKLVRNPNVTVRTRGVMEKCTYCIQRISKVRIGAEREQRKIKEGELQTACQQACPTRAIAFGDINDPESEVARMKAQSLNYGLLADLNVRPRTTYLAKVKNRNEALAGGTKA